jgi:hypothetical protein
METTIESMATRIALHPFFVGMNPRQLAFLTACATAVQFEKGQVIFRESEPADWFYLIETGRVSMESSDGLGDPRLGWSWMFPPLFGTSRRVPSSQLPPSSLTGQSCASIARRITRLVTSF